jgi:hypothetical protein
MVRRTFSLHFLIGFLVRHLKKFGKHCATSYVHRYIVSVQFLRTKGVRNQIGPFIKLETKDFTFTNLLEGSQNAFCVREVFDVGRARISCELEFDVLKTIAISIAIL